MADLTVHVTNGFPATKNTEVRGMKSTGDSFIIDPGSVESIPVILNQGESLEVWANKDEGDVGPPIKFRPDSDAFQLGITYLKADMKWQLTRTAATGTDVNVAVGDDEQ